MWICALLLPFVAQTDPLLITEEEPFFEEEIAFLEDLSEIYEIEFDTDDAEDNEQLNISCLD
ncbi:MAG: hypothetical protein K2X08_05200 [Chlamydiales bacterium]|nr:hypothetical protein [Chlamydiales bacterium]